MKHLVMIVGGYYPAPSPTGKCAEQYLSLIQEYFETDVVCIARSNDKRYEYNKKKVYPAGCSYVYFQKKIENKLKFLHAGSKLLLRVWNSIHQPNNLYWYVNAAYTKLEVIHSTTPINVIFSVGAPMAAHCAAMQFKSLHPEIRWVTYSVDSYAAQNNNKKRFIDFEKKVLSKADYNLLSEEIFNNSPFLYNDFIDRVGMLPYLLPTIKYSMSHKHYFDSSKINFVYAGRFYKKIRNPSFLLEVFMHTQEDAVLHLFCSSDCDKQINQAVEDSHGKIVRHEMVGPEEIAGVYAEADVLVTVGNNLPEFKPSKTFEYIATRKPILNVYYNGVRDDILDKYPLRLQICNSADAIVSAKEIDKFTSISAGKMVLEDEIKSQFKKHMQDSIQIVMANALRW